MRHAALRLMIAVVLAGSVSAQSQGTAPQAGGSSPFAGRWAIVLHPPASQNPGGLSDIPFCILELTGAGESLAARVVDSMGAPVLQIGVKDPMVKDGQLTFLVTMVNQTITFAGKRTGDRIEGTARAAADPEPATWTATITTRDKMPPPEEIQAALEASMPADQRAYAAALAAPAAQRPAILKQFLAAFPESPLREQATLQLAQSYPTASEQATALRAFLKDFPDSRMREQAEYLLTRTPGTAAERQAAEEQFVKDHPTGQYALSLYTSWFDRQVREKPADLPRLIATVDALLAAASNAASPATKASTMNSIADRLMANDILLERALDAIQRGLAAAGDAAPAATRAIYTTTHGQVLFKLGRYDEAGEALKKAVALAGGDGDGEMQLFLGKYYEVKGDEAAALDAYLKAYQMGSPYDTRALLERLYTKRYGSTAALEDRIDELYRAKPRPFDPGRFARPADAPGRVVLAELFSGADCPPCVAADLAFDGFGQRYEPGSVAVLVYHVHIPAPDPLTNPDTEARAKYYGVRGAPTAVIDGEALSSGGGNAAAAGSRFTEYTERIEARVGTRPLATLSGFAMTARGGTIAVKGTAALTAEAANRAGHAVLRVALAQESVRYVGSNGIRFHNFVVRKMLGPAEGVALRAGAAVSFADSVDTKTVTTFLETYLTAYEERMSKARGTFAFREHPTALDPSTLRVVAFVQDDQTKEVLQAVIVK